MPITTEIVMTFIAVASAIATGVGFLLNRNNVHAQTLHTLSQTLNNLSSRVAELENDSIKDHARIQVLEEEGRRDNARIRTLEHLLSICVVGLQALTNQIIRERSEPEWFPPAELDDYMKQFIKSTHKEPKE